MISAAELKHISTDVCVSFMKQAELTMLQAALNGQRSVVLSLLLESKLDLADQETLTKRILSQFNNLDFTSKVEKLSKKNQSSYRNQSMIKDADMHFYYTEYLFHVSW